MGRMGHDDIKDRLLALLRGSESALGNFTLMHELRCNPETYWKVRDMLLDEGVIIKWKGRGGSVKLADRIDEVPAKEEKKQIIEPKKERHLYDSVLKVLREEWAHEQKLDDVVIEVTAHQGAKDTGGRWTRPDVIAVSVSSYPFVPGKFIDVTTFEVKLAQELDITAAYEALAHRRYGTRSILLVYVGEQKKDLARRLDIIIEECSKHGIGLIVAEDIDDYSTWDTRLQPDRIMPDPQRLNELIAGQLKNQKNKDKISGWCR